MEIVQLYRNLASTSLDPFANPVPVVPAPGNPIKSAPDLGIVWFGAEVRRRRMAEGKSLSVLGAEAYLSRAYLGKIEQGRARGTYQIALALDSALAAGGSLADLFLAECAQVGPVPADTTALSVPPRAGFFVSTDLAELLAEAAGTLEALRVQSHQAGPHSVVRALNEGVVELYGRAIACCAADARPLWSIALRYAELLGWTAQEIGHDDKALRWTRMAAEWANLIGDDDALAYAWIRQSQWARRSGDATAAVSYAESAGAMPGISPRVKLFAAQREAQAWALAGGESSFRHALDRYHTLRLAGSDGADSVGGSAAKSSQSSPPWGPLPDPGFENSRILEATCLVDLGDFGPAATLFDQQMGQLRSGRTGYARLAIREAIAYAQIGSPELACEVALRSLPVVAHQGSASLRGDLARLTRVLNRHRSKAVVRNVLPDLVILARAAGAVPTEAGYTPGRPAE